MEGASIVPNGNVVNILPLEPNLKVMVIFEQLLKPLQEHGALLLGHTVDELSVLANRIQAFPARDWICTDDWMDGSELSADVFSSSTWLFVELEITALRRFNEVWAPKGACESFQKLLNGRRDAIV